MRRKHIVLAGLSSLLLVSSVSYGRELRPMAQESIRARSLVSPARFKKVVSASDSVWKRSARGARATLAGRHTSRQVIIHYASNGKPGKKSLLNMGMKTVLYGMMSAGRMHTEAGGSQTRMHDHATQHKGVTKRHASNGKPGKFGQLNMGMKTVLYGIFGASNRVHNGGASNRVHHTGKTLRSARGMVVSNSKPSNVGLLNMTKLIKMGALGASTPRVDTDGLSQRIHKMPRLNVGRPRMTRPDVGRPEMRNMIPHRHIPRNVNQNRVNARSMVGGRCFGMHCGN